jgi:PII-like signaling protein
MKTSERTGIIKVYLDENDKVNGRLLFEEIVFEARKAGMAGATVMKGIMSYGASHSIHTMKIFALSDKLPVIVEIVDNNQQVNGLKQKGRFDNFSGIGSSAVYSGRKISESDRLI